MQPINGLNNNNNIIYNQYNLLQSAQVFTELYIHRPRKKHNLAISLGNHQVLLGTSAAIAGGPSTAITRWGPIVMFVGSEKP